MKFRDTVLQRWKQSPLSWKFRSVNGNLKYLIKRRVHCCLFNMICIIFKLITCILSTKDVNTFEIFWTNLAMVGASNEKEMENMNFRLIGKPVSEDNLCLIYRINDWGYHGLKNFYRVNIGSFFLYIAFVFLIFLMRSREVHLPWVSLSLHIRTTIIIIIFGLE